MIVVWHAIVYARIVHMGDAWDLIEVLTALEVVHLALLGILVWTLVVQVVTARGGDSTLLRGRLVQAAPIQKRILVVCLVKE